MSWTYFKIMKCIYFCLPIFYLEKLLICIPPFTVTSREAHQIRKCQYKSLCQWWMTEMHCIIPSRCSQKKKYFCWISIIKKNLCVPIYPLHKWCSLWYLLSTLSSDNQSIREQSYIELNGRNSDPGVLSPYLDCVSDSLFLLGCVLILLPSILLWNCFGWKS